VTGDLDKPKSGTGAIARDDSQPDTDEGVRATEAPATEAVDEAKESERAEERALFARYKKEPTDRHEEALVEKYRPLVYRIVHSFSHGPDQFEDLVQVGTVGLVLAIRRFDLETGFRFSTYAWTTIRGEIQRYFRDKTWAVNVPRELKERSLRVFNAVNELSSELGQEPTVQELARRTGLSEESVQEAMELGSAYHPASFIDNTREADHGVAESEGGSSPGIGHVDMGSAKRDIFWSSMLAQLTRIEARVLRMYFFEQRTQKEIADELATSQMNVSRIMRLALGKLRRLATPEDFENLGNL
jgi:RNA polymerase sigma-B factor